MGFSSFLIPVSDAGWLRVAQFVAIECKNVKVDENFVVKSWDWRESREVECKRAFCFMSFPECHRSHISASPFGLILYYLIISLGSRRKDRWFGRKIYKKNFVLQNLSKILASCILYFFLCFDKFSSHLRFSRWTKFSTRSCKRCFFWNTSSLSYTCLVENHNCVSQLSSRS